jgi:hypothetical protein
VGDHKELSLKVEKLLEQAKPTILSYINQNLKIEITFNYGPVTP